MKKAIKLFWPLAIFPVLYIPYHYLNTVLIVKWLGCGCPQIDGYGNEITPLFTANDFTICFWLGIAGCVTALALFHLKLLEERRSKVLYVLFMALASGFIALFFYYTMRWK